MITEPTTRPVTEGDVCDCGAPATVVYEAERHGDVPYCGIPHGDDTTTLVEYLAAGHDITEAPGFGNLCDLAKELPSWTEEQREKHGAVIDWDPFGVNEVPNGAPYGGWSDVALYRRYQRWAHEMIESPDALEAFMMALPPTYRVEIERRRWEDAQPDFRIEASIGTEGQRCDVCEVDLGEQFMLRVFPTVNEDLLEHDDILICPTCVRAAMGPIKRTVE